MAYRLISSPRRLYWLLTAVIALSAWGGPAAAQTVQGMTCAGSQVPRTGDLRSGISCTYQQSTSYQPTHDGGPWIYIDMVNTTAKELENIRAGTTKRPAWPQQANSPPPPPMPPIYVVHMTVCLSDPDVAYTQCPNNYPANNSVLGYDLSPAVIPRLTAQLGQIRAAGLKVVLNFTYNWPDCTSANPNCANDAPLGVILQHMGQLAPTLNDNADIIAALHAGFIGQWGEWHSSTSGNDDTSVHNQFLDQFINLFGKTLNLEVRYPYVILDYAQYRGSSAHPEMARTIPLGIHDDEYGANKGDGGTFMPATYKGASTYDACALVQAARTASQTNTLTAEMWNGSYSTDDVCATRPASFLEFSRDYGLTSLHLGLQPATWQGWVADGQYDQILRSIGPHLSLESLALMELAGQPAAMVKIVNTGTARIADSRSLWLIVQRDGQTVLKQELGADLAGVAAGQSMTVETSLGNVLTQPGRYALYLSAPDAKIPGDPRYALMLENPGVPDPATGLNALVTLQYGQ